MEGTGTGAAAMLVGSAEDVGERPDAATITLEREEIEEALASDAPLDLILSVKAGDGEPRDMRVAWQRDDLETVLGKVDAGPVTFSFDRAELYRALEHPDFEGHGMREIVLLVAAASSSAALMAGTASAQVMDAGGGGGNIGAVMDAGGGGGNIGAVMDAGGGGGNIGAVMDAGGGGGNIGAVMDAAAEAATSGPSWTQAAEAAPSGPRSPRATTRRRPRAPSARAAWPSPATTRLERQARSPRRRRRTTRSARPPAASVRRCRGTTRPTLMARGVDPAIATAIGTGDATTARDLAAPAIHEEAGLQARGIGQTVPANDEATLMARGIDPAIATAIGTGDATTARDLATPATPDSGTSFEVPSVDAGTAAVVGGLAGAGLLILGGAFVVRRQRVTPV